MLSLSDLARWLIAAGVTLTLVGGLLLLLNRLGLSPGNLPGDFRIQTGRTTCLIPLASSILISLLLTLALNLILRFLSR